MYGTAPANDEAEIVLFGPGYGEAIVVHVGNRCWLVIDSCINPANKLPASLHYLEQIGVSPGDVKAVIASHWHDDHVRGISKLADAFPQAEFFLSAVFNSVEAKAFLAAFGKVAAPQASGARELYNVVSTHKKIVFTQHRVIVLETTVGSQTVRALALSPSTAAQAKALAHFASHLPKSTSDPITHAPEPSPNLEAIVLHIDFGEDGVLLGSDLENSSSMGWAEIIADSVCGTRYLASLYKVAHHGSITAELADIWQRLLQPDPIAVLTPFTKGAVRLPTPADRTRINSRAASAYITSGATRQPQLDAQIEKRMETMCRNLSPVNAGFGAVRLRKKLGNLRWGVELFERADIL